MRIIASGLLALISVGSASAVPMCGPAQAKYGAVPGAKCAPVDGAVAKRSVDGKCAGGKYGDPRSGGRTHEGLDLLADIGDPVYAAAAGQVVMVGYFPRTSGYQVNVVHGNGAVTRYFHLKDEDSAPSAGSRVAAGDRIGFADVTGNAKNTTCPHLHLELRTAAYAPGSGNSSWTFGGTKDPLMWLIEPGLSGAAAQVGPAGDATMSLRAPQ